MEKAKHFARVLVGVGAMLTAVPLGLAIVTMLSSWDDPFSKAFRLGWAVWVTFGLLPLGIGMLAVGMGYMVKLKRQEKLLADSEEEED